jgi:hypothetical protein
MNMLPSHPELGACPVTIARVADNQWHAVENDLVVGRGHASRRLDGRTFLSIDTWRSVIFDRLAAAMLGDLPGAVYTVVDETDGELADSWDAPGSRLCGARANSSYRPIRPSPSLPPA